MSLYTKRCAQCRQVKPREQFTFVRDKKRGYQWRTSQCNECKNSDTKVRIQIWKSELILTLGGACVDCGTTDHRVLMAHHAYGDGIDDRLASDRRNGGNRRLRYYAALVYRATVAPWLFDLLCANCHLIRHSGFKYGGPTTIAMLRVNRRPKR